MHNYQQIPIQIKCSVCCTISAHRLWGATSKQAAQHFVLQEKCHERFLELMLNIESLWGQNTFEVVHCDKCGFCYSNPYIAGNERFYSLSFDCSVYLKWKREFQITCDV
jgi:hypothetical protein